MKKDLVNYIKERINSNCKKNLYKKQFSEDTQNMILSKIEKIAKKTENESNLLAKIDYEIEDTIRLMILNDKKK